MTSAAPQPHPHPASAADLSVVVIGGGLAGLAAAVRLADAGVRVSVVETRQRLGGRATSFVDPDTGQLIDNCQHVLMGCCTNLIAFYRRLGVLDKIQWHRRMYFQDRRGRLDVLEPDDLPAPLHMTRSLMAFASLSLSEKTAIARGMLKLMRLGPAGRRRWHDRSFADWLAESGQPHGAIEKFWAPVIVSGCNEWPDRVAGDYALQVFGDGFLAHEQASLMGLARVPLAQLYDAAEQVIERVGGQVLLSTRATGIEFDGDQATRLHVSGGEPITADAFVSALPFDRLAKICPPAAAETDPRLAAARSLTVSPILGIHLWFDRPVMTLPHLILTQSPLQWIFNKGDDGEGQHLHGVISAAHDLVDRPADDIAALVTAEVRKALPLSAAAEVVSARVIKEKRATFSACPGVGRHRPAAAGNICNLYLAGDWTQTGWPATMEGAVRSGHLAARALLENVNRPSEPIVADLPPAAIYKWLAST